MDITLLFISVLNTGIFPEQLKIAKVVPIHKKDDETLFTNYLPISLLPSISKFLRKSYLINCISILKFKICSIMHNMVLEMNLLLMNSLTE